jgi:hypothetical protein
VKKLIAFVVLIASTAIAQTYTTTPRWGLEVLTSAVQAVARQPAPTAMF